MRSTQAIAVALLAVASTACYQQVVRTGVTPGSTVVDRQWVPTWIFGLVEAKPIDVRAECPNGVAIVKTGQSFLNGLVGGLTLGIYTPQQVTVTCAAGSAALPAGALEIRAGDAATGAERADALRRAIAESLASGETVVVRF